MNTDDSSGLDSQNYKIITDEDIAENILYIIKQGLIQEKESSMTKQF